MSLSRPTANKFTRKLSWSIASAMALFCVSATPALATGPAASINSPAPMAEGSGGCAPSAVSNPFAQFGDNADYSPVPGGSFEYGAPEWSLTNAAVQSGNESYDVAGGTQSLAIEPNGSAVSPSICVSTANPTFRFFARRTSGSWGVLNVILRWTDPSGISHETTVAALQSGTAWTPSPVLPLATTLPLWQANSTLSVRLVFKPEQYGGAWAIDDAYDDPRMS